MPAIVLGELRAGFGLGTRRARNERELTMFLENPVGSHARRRRMTPLWSTPEIVKALRAAGTPIPSNDIWIAAVAAREGVHVLTYDARFRMIAAWERHVCHRADGDRLRCACGWRGRRMGLLYSWPMVKPVQRGRRHVRTAGFCEAGGSQRAPRIRRDPSNRATICSMPREAVFAEHLPDAVGPARDRGRGQGEPWPGDPYFERLRWPVSAVIEAAGSDAPRGTAFRRGWPMPRWRGR